MHQSFRFNLEPLFDLILAVAVDLGVKLVSY